MGASGDLNWSRDLNTAPKELEPGAYVLFWHPDEISGPEAVGWTAYEDDVKAGIGEDGYWHEIQSLVSDMTGGIKPTSAKDGWWTVVRTPGANTPR